MYHSGVEMLTVGEAVHVWGQRVYEKSPVPSSHCCCEPKTALKNKVCLKDDDDDDDIGCILY